MQVGNGGAVGSISNITGVVDSGTLVFNNSGTVGYAGVISGIGGVVQNGLGTLILTANETYSGNTTVSNGTLQLPASGSIPSTAAIVVNAGATFDASANGLTLRSAVPSEVLSGGGTVKGAVTVTAGTKIIPGADGVIGTLTLNSNLNVNGGNLVFDVTNSPGASDQIMVGGILGQNSGNVLINVRGTPLANGLYPLVHAANGLSGAAANLIAIGFLQAGQLAVLTNSTPNELDLYVYSGIAPSLTWQGDSSQNLWDTTASSIWQGAALYTQGAYVTFDNSGSASPAVNLDIVEYPAAVTVSSTQNYTFGVNGGSGVNRISGGASLTNNGPGTVILQTVNDYSGNTAINGGVVQLNGDGGANDDGMVGVGNLINNGTLIANNAKTETLSGNITGSGLLVQQGVGELILAGNNSAYSGPISITNLLQVGNGASGTLGTGNVTNNGSLIFNLNSPNSVAVSANINGSGGITNLGSGTTTLNGTDTYAGSTVVSGGKLVLGSANALPNTTSLILNDNTNGSSSVGTLDLNGNSFTVPSLSGTNTGNGLATLVEGLIVNNGSGTSTLTINGGTTNTYYGQILDNNNAGTGKVALSIINGSSLTLVAPVNAVPAIAFPNNFTGGITVSNATLALGAIVSTTPSGEGTAAIGNAANQNLTLTGTNDFFFPADTGGSTTPTINTVLGTLNVTAGTTAWIYGSQRGQLGVTTLTGSGSIIYQPNYVRDRLTFGNASGFTGNMTFELLTNSDAGNGAIGYDGPRVFPMPLLFLGTTNVLTVALYGSTTVGTGAVFPIGSLAGGDSTAELAGSSQNAGANVIYAIGGLNTSTIYGGQIVDAVGVRKVGTGSLTLTNTVLSWSGQTVVSNGTLIFAPSTTTNALAANYLVSSNYTLVSPGIMDVSAVGGTLYLGHVASQTLFGNGTLNGSLVVSNSLIAPGRRASNPTNYVGNNLTVTNTVTFKLGSTVLLGINRTNSPANDSLTAVSIAYGGTLTVTNFGDTAFPNASTNVFQLFNGVISGTFTATNLPVLPANEYWDASKLGVNGSIALINTSPAVNTNPATANFTAVVAGGSLMFNWAPDHMGWQLYTNSVGLIATNSWFPIPGSASVTNETITINPANPNVFFQLRYP